MIDRYSTNYFSRYDKTTYKMIKKIIFICLLFSFNSLPQQSGFELELVGRVWFPGVYHGGNDTTGTSDCWGYTAPDGTDYAIIGVYEGVAFIRIPDLKVVDVIPGPKNNDYYFHRDMKTYKHYAYEVSEMNGENEGLMIMDLQYLPDSVKFVKSYTYSGNNRSHNFSIDTANGFAYVLAQNYTGFRIIDLNDPENPVDISFVNTGGIHDVYARKDTVYVAEGYNSSYSIYDVTNKNNAVLLNRWVSPTGGYAHNIWPSDDGKFVMTTEETLNRTVKFWDISDINNIQLRGQYLGENNIAHNAHIKGNFAFLSHYRGGLKVVDISNPDTLKEVASYSTYGGLATGNFYGNWGAYPFTKDGYVYGSDIEGWLTVVKFVPVATNVDYEKIPQAFKLEQNYPNPFNPATKIKFSIPVSSNVSLKVFDVLGREAATLVNEEKSAGDYEVEFDGSDFSSGTYFYRVRAGSFISTRKMLLLK